MLYINLEKLDFGKMRRWVKDAKCEQQTDPVTAFIKAWIGFNYYYSTFASTNKEEFSNWTSQNLHGQRGDKAKLTFLISHKDFKQFFSDFKKRHATVFNKSIDLPVIDMLTNNPVPEIRSGAFKLESLSEDVIFQVIYQVRNNLFHGNKDPEKNGRDMKLSVIACEFMIPFLIDLIKHTYGEVRGPYEPFSWEC